MCVHHYSELASHARAEKKRKKLAFSITTFTGLIPILFCVVLGMQLGIYNTFTEFTSSLISMRIKFCCRTGTKDTGIRYTNPETHTPRNHSR